MLAKESLSIIFLWHWSKKLTNEERGVFAVTDSLINAIGKLSSIYSVKIVSISRKRDYEIYSQKQNIEYIFRDSVKKLLAEVTDIDPDILFVNHHPLPYGKLLKNLDKLSCKKMIYYSSPIENLSRYHKRIDFHIVHHEYQKKKLEKKGICTKNIYVAPKTADLEVFRPIDIEKKWDCVYPTRGEIGYWKRPELAIEACRINNMSIVMPGAKVPAEYDWVTTFEEWKSPEELAITYNQARCLVITSNDKEMGPRVIPEAAACNIPIVCCSDSPACVSHIKKIGGFIAEPDSEDIAKKIEVAVNETVDTRQRLIDIGYDYNLLYRELTLLVEKAQLDSSDCVSNTTWARISRMFKK